MSPIFGSGERLRLAGVVLLAVTFAVGGLAGAALNNVIAKDTAAQEGEPRERRDDENDSDRRRRGFPHDILGTTPEQRAAIDGALENGRERMNALWAEYEPRFDAEVDSTRAAVRAILTDVQEAKFDSLRAARKREREERERSGDSR